VLALNSSHIRSARNSFPRKAKDKVFEITRGYSYERSFEPHCLNIHFHDAILFIGLDGELAPSSVRKLRDVATASSTSPLKYVVLSGLQLMLAVIVICLKACTARAVLVNEPWRFRTSASVRLIRFFSSEQDFPNICAISVSCFLC